MDKDRTEQNNLAEQNPRKVREMEAMYTEWAWRVGVMEWTGRGDYVG